MVILEDIRWAGQERQTLLQGMHQVRKQNHSKQAMMVVTSYRIEDRPNLPSLFPTAQSLILPRLDKDSIIALSESMLGESGRQPEIVHLLEQETEGNTFFIVEVMRTLAEETGHLEQIGRTSLPRRVFARGIQMVVQRRLDRGQGRPYSAWQR